MHDAMKWDDALWPNYGTPPITLSHGEGVNVYDTEGRHFVDLLAGIAVSSLGHAHPAIVQAVSAQVAQLVHTSNLYGNEPAIALAHQLRRLLPGRKAFLCNSGTEANEAALKLVRKVATERGKEGVVVAFANSFHGRSLGSLALTGQSKYHTGFAPLPGGVVHIPYNDVAAIEKVFEQNTVIGFFAEFVQGEGGVVPMTQEAADAMAKACKEHEAILVADEIQTGIARTGRMFAFQHYGLEPDVVTLAKGLGGGMPIGVTMARDELAAIMTAGTHGTTFGGNPVAAAAATAVLETIESEGLIAHAQELGELLEAACADLGLEQRGLGLLRGIPVPDAAPVVKAMREHGYLVGQAGKGVVRIAPPLIVPGEALTAGLEQLATILASEVTGVPEEGKAAKTA